MHAQRPDTKLQRRRAAPLPTSAPSLRLGVRCNAWFGGGVHGSETKQPPGVELEVAGKRLTIEAEKRVAIEHR